jgi:hypothetical protein
MKTILSLGALALFMMALSTGCASKPPPVITVCYPPVVYLQDVPEPTLDGRTNKDLVEYVLKLRESLKRSNLDKFHLREWASENHAIPPSE